jgi:penicillin-binding protein 1C
MTEARVQRTEAGIPWLASLLTVFVLAVGKPTHASDSPTFASVRAAWQSSEGTLTDRTGAVLQTIRLDPTVRKGEWIALAAVSPAVIDGLLAAEDKRFESHSGVDWAAISQAVIDNLSRTRPRGASTITMQLAAILDRDLALQGKQQRTIRQKISQAAAALSLESEWTKAQILEAYLNLTSFRGELTGIDAASRGLFGQAPSGLAAEDGALLAALVRAPNAPPTIVGRRACALLQARAPLPPSGCERVLVRAQATLKPPYGLPPIANEAPHLARQLFAESAPATRVSIRTTLRADLQRVAIGSMQTHLAELSARQVRDAAAIVIDNASGEVLAYVGGVGALSSAPQVDMVRARRQAGSTLKPFVYAAALEDRLLTAASLLDDSPTAFATPVGIYQPQNYDRDFKGWVTVRTALAASLNIPAVKALEIIGVERGYRTLAAAGLDVEREAPDFYGFALALGGVDVSLLRLSNAYRAFAQGGLVGEPQFVPSSAPSLASRPVFAPGTAWIIADILADRGARALTFGTDSVLATRGWTAVKTGTSKDMRDNWCIGFSQRYTVGVWVGNANGKPMRDVSGVAGAAPIWADLMRYLHAAVPSLAPLAPATIAPHRVTYQAAIATARREWFLAGTEADHLFVAAPAAGPRITYPTSGLTIARDPDIPRGREVVPVDVSAPLGNLRLRLNQRWLDAREFIPTVGRQRLELVARDGKVVQVVDFSVR